MREDRAAEAALVLTGIAVIALTFRDYGVGWDDWVQARYGELSLAYFTSGFRDRSSEDFINMRYYGPLFDMAAAAVYRFAPDAKYEIRHLVSALAGLATISAVLRFGALVGMRWVPVLTALALATMPGFYGQAFINSKDVPFACAFAWSMLAMTRLFVRGAFAWRDVLGCALLFGVTAAVRPGGLLLLFPVLGFTAVVAALAGRFDVRRERERRLLAKLEAMVGITWLVMVAAWPWAHVNPLGHPALALRVATAFQWVYPVLFEGRTTPSDALPWYYLLKTIAITTPPAVLALAAIGLGTGLAWQVADVRRTRSFVCLVAQVWLLLPVGLWTLRQPNIYDGMRHFLFVLPALAFWAGLGGAALLGWLRGPARAVVAFLIVAALLSPIRSLVRLHPYEMTYFNGFVGGLAGAGGRYETDYWATSYKEGMGWIAADRLHAGSGPARVLVAANEFSLTCAAYYASDEVRVEADPGNERHERIPDGFDYYLATTRFALDRNYADSPVVHTVGRDGATFAVIRRRLPPSEQATAGPATARHPPAPAP